MARRAAKAARGRKAVRRPKKNRVGRGTGAEALRRLSAPQSARAQSGFDLALASPKRQPRRAEAIIPPRVSRC
jgi:hypothetical protein